MSEGDGSDFALCRLESVEEGESASRVIEQVGERCREAAAEAKRRRPRAKFVELEDIPDRLKLRRRMAFYASKGSRKWPSVRKRRSEFSKSLQEARPHVTDVTKIQKQGDKNKVHGTRETMIMRQALSEDERLGESSDTDRSESEWENASHSESEGGMENTSDAAGSELESSFFSRLDDCDEEAYYSRTALLAMGSSTQARFETLDEGFKVRSDQFEKLFDYQKQGVKWMWKLHKQKAGGIIGDEMGLGKTAQVPSMMLRVLNECLHQVITFLVTLLCHWLDEIRKWYPWLRTCILHDSMSRTRGRMMHKNVIDGAVRSATGVLITTYEHLRIYERELLPIEWGYAVLDEGHKIKNPEADITLVVKQLRTRHRLIITGSPVQNKLTELWSLFDFIFPGKLGTLPVFETEFGIPIQIGGYKNASRLSVATAVKCAAILRDTISPYMLIRNKHEVDVHLPSKREQVLFCQLSDEQANMYKGYIESPEVESIVQQRKRVLAGIDVLRKICNHPDLLQPDQVKKSDYGDAARSGKLKVVLNTLNLWKAQGDKVLVFTQTQMMLDIIEFHLQQGGYLYHRMDGCTSIQNRDSYIKSFNSNPDVFAFLLTTKVGGLGVSLTGANRVILYDPDWNPSVDIQARERAWRIGQGREVTIYRLITAGTIEEKIYHRQLFKQLLTDKVLKKRPSQKRLFSSKRIRDLFTLDLEKSTGSHSTETESLLKDAAATVGEQEDPILRQLFTEGHVSCALDQKAVEKSNTGDTHDPVSYQARLNAEEARDRIEVSGNQRLRFAVHFPTWTGKKGMAGAPPSFKEAAEFGLRLQPDSQAPGVCRLEAPSSESVLDKLRKRRDGVPREPSPPVPDRYQENEAFQSMPAKPLPVPKQQKTTQAIKRHRTVSPLQTSKETQAVKTDALDEISKDERAKWKSMIVSFFKQRGRVASADQVKCLVQQISHEKRPMFKSMLVQLTNKVESTKRWVLDPDIGR